MPMKGRQMEPKTPIVVMVVAAGRNGVIGSDGDMPWRMRSSLRRFRALTMGKPMIMGRKTFESIGKPLDGRDTIVVTRNKAFKVEGVHVAADLAAALRIGADLAAARKADEIVIAGGGEIYRQALAFASVVHLDLIDATPAGDTTFPQLDPGEWQEVGRETVAGLAEDEHALIAVRFERTGEPRAIVAA
jgi:dihydrofolate reductase